MINKDNSFDLGVRWYVPNARHYAFAFIALFIFLIVIYGNSFQCGWHFDDSSNILNNEDVHLEKLSWPDIKKIFRKGVLKRPFSYFSFAINYYFGGKEVSGYHVVNFVIHYIASIFLFLFIYRTLNLPLLKERYEKSSYAIAILGTFFWATNPVQLMAVTYIVQRMASMAAMFYIMAMFFYLQGRTDDNPRKKIVFFILCALFAGLSFGTKENAAMLPASLFLYDLFLIQGITRENLKKNTRIIVFLILALIVLTFIYRGDPFTLLEGYNNRPFTLTERLLTEPRVIILYITLLLYPMSYRLTMLHDIEISRAFFDPWTTLPAILFILFIIGYAIFSARKRPFIAFCILFFFLNHVIEGSFIPLELIFEHRNYIPSMLFFIPFAIIMAHVLDYFSYKKSIQFMMVFGIIFALAGQGHTTYMRNKTVKTSLKLWADNVDKAPNLSIVHNNLGKEYHDRGLYTKAYEEYKKAIQLNRYINLAQTGLAYYNSGNYYLYEKKDIDRAFPYFKKAKEIGTSRSEIWASLSYIQIKKGNISKAYQYIHEGRGYWPEDVTLLRSLCEILIKDKRIDEAIKEAYKILLIEPDDIFVMSILGEAFRRKGDYTKAIRYWEQYLKKIPTSIKGNLALIELYSKAGKRQLLDETIGKIMYLKREKSFYDVIVLCPKNEEFIDYVPDPEIIMPIIQKTLLNEAKNINANRK